MSGMRRVTPGRLVTVYDPAGSPYYRLDYTDELGLRRVTSAGRTLAGAMKKALEVERRLGLSDSAAMRATTVSELFDAFEDPARPKFDRPDSEGRSWSGGYTDLIAQRMTVLRPALGHIKLRALSPKHLHKVVNSASTYNQAKALRGTLSSVVSYGVAKGFLVPDQQFIAKVDINVGRGPRPERLAVAREQGEHVLLVGDHEIPSDDAVALLAGADVGYCHWEGLVYVLAYVGPRIHEALPLTADDVVGPQPELDAAALLRIRRQLVEPKGGGVRLTPPKNGCARTVVVLEETPSGFHLAAWLLARADEARREQAAGLNPLALLFPSPRRHMYWRLRNLRSRLFDPAADAAGWMSRTFTAPARVKVAGSWVTVPKTYRQWDHPIHSLRHRFATTARDDWDWRSQELCLAGGWASEEFVTQRYYGVTKAVLVSAASKQRAAVARRAKRTVDVPVGEVG